MTTKGVALNDHERRTSRYFVFFFYRIR